MTDKKITDLTNIVAADLVDADEFVVVDISDDETKAITLGELKTAVGDGAGDLLAANNLSDLADAATSRTNLGLGTAATTASTDYATAAQGTTADAALPKAGGAMTGDLSFGDGIAANFGTANELEIVADPTSSKIESTNTLRVVSDLMQIGGPVSPIPTMVVDHVSGTQFLNSLGTAALYVPQSGNVEVNTDLDVTGTVDATAFAGDGSALTNLTSGNLVGALPAIDGSNLTGIAAGGGAGGGGSDEIFWENRQNVTTNYTITNGKNAMSAGPITIDSGVTVTVGAGETWTVI